MATRTRSTGPTEPAKPAKPAKNTTKTAGGWLKSSDQLKQRFDEALPDHPNVIRRWMFGYPCAFVNGWFFVGLFEESTIIRAPAVMVAELKQVDVKRRFDPLKTGRGMKAWYVLPDNITRSPKQLTDLFAAALPLLLELPAKKPKPRAKPRPPKVAKQQRRTRS